MAHGYGEPFHLISNGSNNARMVRQGQVILLSVWATNTNAAIRFLKFFDTGDTPNPASDVPVFVCGLPGNAAGAGGSLAIPIGLFFQNGLGMALVTGAADGNNAAVAAGELVVSFVYRPLAR